MMRTTKELDGFIPLPFPAKEPLAEKKQQNGDNGGGA